MSTFLYSMLYFYINLKIIKLIRCKISIKISIYCKKNNSKIIFEIMNKLESINKLSIIGIVSFSFVQEMIPTAKVPDTNNAKHVDGVLPQHFPTTYYKLLRYTCYSFNESITTVYTHRVIGWRICPQCYFTLPNNYQLYYNVGNEGHYMIVPETANTTCGLCNKILLKPNKPACECLDCIEEYLNHPLATNLSLELEVRNHLFDNL